MSAVIANPVFFRIQFWSALLLALAVLGNTTQAEEVAELYNGSSYPVTYYVQWSGQPNMGPYTLPPGRGWHYVGFDGQLLTIFFNAAPDPRLPPRGVSYLMATRRQDPRFPGPQSSFRNVTPGNVDLFYDG